MPNPSMDNLTKDSNNKDIQDAISAEIKHLMEAKGYDQKQAAAAAYAMARERSGKRLMSQK
jgi:predicted XRE-type DNA-binding protein